MPRHRKTADPVRKDRFEQLGVPSPSEKTETPLRAKLYYLPHRYSRFPQGLEKEVAWHVLTQFPHVLPPPSGITTGEL